MMKFDLRLIVPSNETYNGLSYGGWAAIWCNWLFSSQDQTSSVYFLRGNVDKEPKISMTGKKGLTLSSDVAIFFPIICTVSSSLAGPHLVNEMQRRQDSTEPELNAKVIKLKINGRKVPNLRNYYAESAQFILEVTKKTQLHRYFDPPLKRGKSEAVTAGYWILLKPLPKGMFRIEFEGRHRDGFKTSGDYSIRVVERAYA